MNFLLSSYVHWWNAEAAYAAALAEVLQADGHRVWLLTRRGTFNGAQLRARGLDTLNDFPLWEKHPRRLLQAVRDLADFQTRERIDVVNVFRSRELAWHLWAARGQSVSVVRTRGSARPIRGHWINRKLYRDGCHGIVASSEVVRRDLVGSLGLEPERVRTIYYPADALPAPNPDRVHVSRNALKAELGLPEDALLLAIVGRVYPEKGHLILLDALQRLVARHPQIALLVLDKAVDDPPEHRAKVQAREAQLNLSERVRWLGFRDDVRELMGLVHVGVIPSLASEVNCRVAMEFFAAGVPVVALPTGALPEVVESGVSGSVAAAQDPAALADALEPLLADEALRASLAAGARRQAETRFSRSRFLAESLSAFEDALRQRSSAG